MALEKMIKVRVPQVDIAEFDEIAINNNSDRSKLIRLLIQKFLQEYRQNGSAQFVIKLEEPA